MQWCSCGGGRNTFDGICNNWIGIKTGGCTIATLMTIARSALRQLSPYSVYKIENLLKLSNDCIYMSFIFNSIRILGGMGGMKTSQSSTPCTPTVTHTRTNAEHHSAQCLQLNASHATYTIEHLSFRLFVGVPREEGVRMYTCVFLPHLRPEAFNIYYIHHQHL